VLNAETSKPGSLAVRQPREILEHYVDDRDKTAIARAAAQISEGMRHAEEQRTSQAPSRRKTKRELREEENARRFEQLRKDNISAVYKRLAKVVHADLEANPAEREKKGRVMQEVTAAWSVKRSVHTAKRASGNSTGPDVGPGRTDRPPRSHDLHRNTWPDFIPNA